MSASIISSSFSATSLMPQPYEGKMSRSGGIATKVGGIDPQLCVDEWRRRYPFKTAACVADRYGAPLRTVENWLSMTSTPSFYWVGVILQVEDPQFVVAVMPHPPAYLVDASRRHQLAAAEKAAAAANAELARLRVPA